MEQERKVDDPHSIYNNNLYVKDTIIRLSQGGSNSAAMLSGHSRQKS